MSQAPPVSPFMLALVRPPVQVVLQRFMQNEAVRDSHSKPAVPPLTVNHLLWQDYVATLRNAVEGICYPLIEEVKEHGENLGERPR